jgi:hypothetical protein
MFMAKYPNTMTDATLNTTVALIIYSLGKLHKECRQCLVLAVRTPQLDINGSHLLLQISQLCHHTEGYLKLSPYLLLTTGPVNKKDMSPSLFTSQISLQLLCDNLNNFLLFFCLIPSLNQIQ